MGSVSTRNTEGTACAANQSLPPSTASLALTVCGLAVFWQYIRGSFIFAFFSTDLHTTGMQLAYDAVVILVALAISFLPALSRWLFDQHREFTFALLVASTVVLLCSAAFPGLAALSALAALFGGISFVLLSIAWGRDCIRRTHMCAARLVPMCVALSYLLSFVIALPLVWADWDGWFYALCPAVSGLLWLRTALGARDGESDFDELATTRPQVSSKNTLISYIVITVVVAISGILAGLSGDVETDDMGNRRFFESMAFAAVLLVLVLATFKRPEFNVVVWVCALLVLLVGALATLVLQDTFTQIGADILTVGRRSIWVLFLLLLVSSTRRTLEVATRDIAIFFTASFGLSRIIIDVTRLLRPVQEPADTAMAFLILLIAALLIVCAFVIAGARLLEFFQANTDRFAGTPPVVAQPDNLRTAAISQLAQQYALTERERDTFEQLAQGHTMPHVADVLGVSTSTVRTHAKAIYRKLDCHSKQDLINLVDQQMGQ